MDGDKHKFNLTFTLLNADDSKDLCVYLLCLIIEVEEEFYFHCGQGVRVQALL